MIQLISILVSVLKWIPVDGLVALAKAIVPLPDFKDREAVKAWLAGLSISGPLGDVILGFLPESGPVIYQAEPFSESQAVAQIQAELEKQGFEKIQWDQVTQIVLAILKAIGILA